MTMNISSPNDKAQLLISNISNFSDNLSNNNDFINNLEKSLSEQPAADLKNTNLSNLELVEEIKNKIKNAFYDSYNSHSTPDKNNIEKLKKLLKENDADNSLGLSLNELKAIDTSDGSQFSNFIDNLETNFKEYDSDKDGQLNLNELFSALPKGEFSGQEIKAITESYSADTSNGINSYLSSADNFLGTVPPVFFLSQLMEVYQNEKTIP